MPKQGNKRWRPHPPPDERLPADTAVWVVRATNEIFLSYENYIKVVTSYMSCIWTCDVTGRTNLTLEEALTSEKNAISAAEDNFPESHKKFVLSRIHFCEKKTKTLVTDMMNTFKTNILVGESGVQIRIPGKKKQSRAPRVDVVSALEDNKYLISYAEQEEEKTAIVEFEKLFRKNLPIKHDQLKQFIRTCTKKSSHRKSPLIVKEEYIKRYALPEGIPPQFQQMMATRKRKRIEQLESTKEDAKVKVLKKMPKTQIKYPIEDTDLTKTDRCDEGPKPNPCRRFIFSSEEDVIDMFALWDFITCHADFLRISVFSSEAFQHALSDEERTPNKLLTHVFAAILNALLIGEEDPPVKTSSPTTVLGDLKTYLASLEEPFPECVADFQKTPQSMPAIIPTQKVKLLKFLVEQLLTTSPMHEELDNRMEEYHAARRALRELFVEINARKREVTKTSETLEAPTFSDGDLEAPPAPSNFDDLNKRQRKNALLRHQREYEERVKQLRLAREQHWAKKQQQINNERKKREEEDQLLANKALKLQQEVARKDLCRRLPLGMDRDRSRYYHFFNEPYRIYVESGDHNGWGYYETIPELEKLLSWLNEKGVREKKLKKKLNELKHFIVRAMEDHEHDTLSIEQRAHQTRHSGKREDLVYVNDFLPP